MANWWYSENESKKGPIGEEEIIKLIQSGAVDPKSMIWREGQEGWQILEDVPELNKYLPASPPPLPNGVARRNERPSKNDVDVLAFPLATRWPRYFARIFDLWWETILVVLVLSFVLSLISTGFVEWIYKPGSDQILGFVSIPIGLVLDAIVYRFAGNTPGKALLGLKVGQLNGMPLTLGQYLQRNFGMWMSGLGFGFPVVTLVTMIIQANKVARGQQTSYDEPYGYRVRAKPVGWISYSAYTAGFAGILFLVAFLNMVGNKSTATPYNYAHQYDAYYKLKNWENPTTHKIAKISSRWNENKKKNDIGETYYMFTEQENRALVVFAVQSAPGASIREYANSFIKNNSSNMHFKDGGYYSHQGEREIWSDSGTMQKSANSQFNVEVIRSGSNFTRVVTLQIPPYEYSKPMVEKIKNALIGTI